VYLSLGIIPKFKDGLLYLTIISNGAEPDEIGPIPLDGQGHLEPCFSALLTFPEPEPPGAHPPSKKLRKRARKTELDIAEDIGGKAQKASGALPWAKGDVRKRGEHRIEAKTSRTKSYRVTRKELNKIRGECGFGEKPAFIISFVNPTTLREEDKWVLQPYGDWHEANVNRAHGDPRSSKP
jgi:hypothetical protein